MYFWKNHLLVSKEELTNYGLIQDPDSHQLSKRIRENGHTDEMYLMVNFKIFLQIFLINVRYKDICFLTIFFFNYLIRII